MISGSGAVQQLGPGTTTLTANNTYTGGTVVNAGILQLGAGRPAGSIVGTATVNATTATWPSSRPAQPAICAHGQWRRLRDNLNQQQPDGGHTGARQRGRRHRPAGGATLTAGDASNGPIDGAASPRNRQLTVGSNNLSTTVSGVIADAI